MRVLVTGIDGFVGSHLAELLLKVPGVEIHGTIFDPKATRNIEHIKSSLHLHHADLLDSSFIESLVARVRPQRIIHLAGQAFVPSSLDDPVGTFRTNIFGGIAVLEATRKLGLKHSPAVLVVSTGEVYGKVSPELQPITENVPIQPNNPYAASKASIDLIARQYRMTFGLDVTVVRPLNHAGPRQSPIFVCSDFGRQFAEIAGGTRSPVMKVGNIDARRDFTDVRDVVRAYWKLFDRSSDDAVFNVCSGKAVQIREVISLLEEISGKKVEVVVEERRIRSYDTPVVVGSYDLLKKTTGWTPAIPLRQTLQDVFAYWQHELSLAG